jgi:cell division protein FtsI/penicillin-binding protein 2
MCMAYGAIANGGVLMKPRLIDRVIKPNGRKTEVIASAARLAGLHREDRRVIA